MKEYKIRATETRKYNTERETWNLKKKSVTSNTQSPKSKIIKISELDKLQFFPNLSRRVVLNLSEESDPDDDDDDDESAKTVQDIHKKNESFHLELERFLKEARNSSKPSQSAVILINPKMLKNKIGIAFTHRLKAHTSKWRFETKKKLIDNMITHLSKIKQEEYVRLKEMVEKRQLEKQLRKPGEFKNKKTFLKNISVEIVGKNRIVRIDN